MQSTVLMTSRLTLREFQPHDWSVVFSYGGNAEATRHVEWGPLTPDQARRYVQHVLEEQVQEPRRDYDLIVEAEGRGVGIGKCGLHLPSAGAHAAWLEFYFCQQYWGKGYATEAATAILEFGFTELKLHRITATCDIDNVGSARVLTKLGFVQEAHFREHKLVRGQWRDSLGFALLHEDFLRTRTGATACSCPRLRI